MATNISKYVQLNDFLLLEYEFSRDGTISPLVDAKIANTLLGTKYFYEGIGAPSYDVLAMNSMPINAGRTSWYFDKLDSSITYPPFWSSSIPINGSYPRDTIKLHIVSGYNFDDNGGFLLQVRADSSNRMVDLANFTYAKQPLATNVVNFASNTLFLGNRFYDKYIKFEVPSVQELGGDGDTSLGSILAVNSLSDVHITFSTILDIINNNYVVDEQITVQLPVTSVADSFNCYIAESTSGDYIEYYALWNDYIIGDYMGDIESGKIRLYTSNNPNDNAQQFSDSYGYSTNKWVLIHEISVFEHIPGGTSLLTQKYSFTQENGFSTPNYFRPILINSDLDSSYSIQYTCRLMNRMDGTQIIRKASFSSSDPKKYGNWLTRLNVDNLIPYKVFNKIEAEKANLNVNNNVEKTKYVKVFFDTVTVVMNYANEIFPEGTGPLFLKSYDSTYKFKFEKIEVNGDKVNVDLSGAYNYALIFKLDDNSKIEVGPTYSTNMNTTIGEIEFKLSEDQLTKLQNQKNNNYSIVVKNPNGTQYSFYEGVFYPLSDEKAVMANYQSMYTVTDLQQEVADLQVQVNKLTAENQTLKSK